MNLNPAHIHLLLNHFPVIGTILGFLLLLVAILTKSTPLKRGSFGLFVLIALLALPVYLTGEPAEEIVEGQPGVSQQIIEEHEDSALLSLIAIEALGVVGLVGLVGYRRRDRLPDYLVWSVAILAIVGGGLVARTANLGGQIHHSEVRPGYQAPHEGDDDEERMRDSNDDDDSEGADSGDAESGF